MASIVSSIGTDAGIDRKIYDYSFETNDKISYLVQQEIYHPIVDINITESFNDVHSWDMDRVWLKHMNSRSLDNERVAQQNVIFGADTVLELPRKFSRLEKSVFVENRQARRNAIHIYDRERFLEILKWFIMMKRSHDYAIR